MTCRVRRQNLHKSDFDESAPERADGDIETEWEKNYGDEKNNWAQVGTNGPRCPQDGTRYSQDGAEGGPRCPQDGTRYSQDGAEGGLRCPQDGTRYSQDRAEGGTRCPQDGAKA